MINSYKDLKIGFIGAGKVGFSLGKLFCENGIHVTGYYNWHVEAAKEAADFTKTQCFYDLESLVDSSNALFLTVPDGEISSVFQSIKDLHISEKLICHTSGALSSTEAFSQIDEVGAYGYSVHPLFPVSSKSKSYRELADAFFCVEGHERYIHLMDDMLKSIGIHTKLIDSKNKVKYHAACAISSNLICGLVNESISLLGECGFADDEALAALGPLMKSNLDHILTDGLDMALTGPIERNDTTTVAKHVECFDTEAEKALYQTVSRQVLAVAKRKHADRNYSEMERMLIGD